MKAYPDSIPSDSALHALPQDVHTARRALPFPPGHITQNFYHTDMLSSPSYEFGDLDSACGLLNKELSPYAATVHKQLKLQGLATLNDTFESLLLLAYEQEKGLR